MSVTSHGLVLLDNTVLTNFALIERTDLVLTLWPGACTTPGVMAEYMAGVAARGLPAGDWNGLALVRLTAAEQAVADRFSQRLGRGERTCIAVAQARQGLFVSDDRDARQTAKHLNVRLSGSLSVLILNIRRGVLTLGEGNRLLAQLIGFGYRSPVSQLDAYL